jgi:prepilin-type N-terminal cleavage/methylation domain-containing protein
LRRRVWRAARDARGFTLIEVFIVLAVLGLILGLAVPRYLGSRRLALGAEADNVLQEVKMAAWSYYQQYASWTAVALGMPLSGSGLFGVTPPANVCWNFGVVATAQNRIVLQARANQSGRPVCALLSPAATIELILQGDGSSSRTQQNL